MRASAVGPDGSLYLATTDDIRRVDESGEHHVIGDSAAQAWSGGAPDIAVGDDGTVYVADPINDRLLRIDGDGTVTTVAGGGGLDPGENEGGQATESRIFEPWSVEVDAAGTVYVSHGVYVSEIAPDGTINTVTGFDDPDHKGDRGPADALWVGDQVGGLAVDAEDNVYIADRDYGVVRRVDGEGAISTVGVDFDDVSDLAIGPDGNLYFVAGAQVKMFVLNAEPAPEDELSEADAESPWSERESGDIVTVAGIERDPGDAKEEQETGQDGQQPAMDHGARWQRQVAARPDGTVYYTAVDLHQVAAVAPDGRVEVIAGTGERGPSGDGGPAAEAELDSPEGLAVDDDGVVYVAGGGQVRMIDQDGVISTVAGAGPKAWGEGAPLVDDGPAKEAGLTADDVAVGPDGSLYIADPGYERIRRVDPDGVITTVAGGGELRAEEADDEPATDASLWAPRSVAVDSDGNVYFIEGGMPYVRKISPDGVLTTIAGDSYLGRHQGGFAGDGGPAVQAELNTPIDMAVGPDGGVYVADMFNARVRRIDPDGTIDTVAGTGERDDTGDRGPAVAAAVNEPTSVAVGPNGSLYLTGPDNGTIRTVGTDGTISTLADVLGDDDQPGSEEAGEIELNVEGIAAGPVGALYVIDSDRGPLVVDPDGSTSSAPREAMNVGVDDVMNTVGADDVTTAVSAGDGSFYVASADGGVHHVYPDGDSRRVAGGGGYVERLGGDIDTAYSLSISELAVDPDGVLHMLHEESDDSGEGAESTVYRVGQDGTLTVVTALDEETSSLSGFAVDDDARIYRTDERNNRVIGIDDDGSVSTVAGKGGSLAGSDASDGDGGDATEATVARPQDVVVADDGAVYIADRAGVRRVDSGGTISTLYEAPEDDTGDGQSPRALSIGSNGDVYFVDTSTEQVRVIVQADEVPNPNPFPWKITAAVGLAMIVVVGVALGVWRRRQLVELIQRLRRRGIGASARVSER